MRYIKGFVCTELQKFTDGTWTEFIYGPAMDPKIRLCENFITNGFIPFPTLRFATEVCDIIKQDSPESIIPGVARIEMSIAETVEEIESFRDSTSLALIWHQELGPTLVGANYWEGTPWPDYPLPGLKMFKNGYRAITTFDEAFYIASERQRQGGGMYNGLGAKCDFAIFHFERLS